LIIEGPGLNSKDQTSALPNHVTGLLARRKSGQRVLASSSVRVGDHNAAPRYLRRRPSDSRACIVPGGAKGCPQRRIGRVSRSRHRVPFHPRERL